MFTKLADFYATYEPFTAGTLKLLGALTDDSLASSAAPGHRTLGQVAWHITTTIPEMMSRTGLGLHAVSHETPPPGRAAEIVAAYRKASAELVETIRRDWTDATLQETDDLYGERWPRGLTLRILLDHETHHRGQMTVLMRRAGLRVPGIFGPAKEDWAAFGTQAPPY